MPQTRSATKRQAEEATHGSKRCAHSDGCEFYGTPSAQGLCSEHSGFLVPNPQKLFMEAMKSIDNVRALLRETEKFTFEAEENEEFLQQCIRAVRLVSAPRTFRRAAMALISLYELSGLHSFMRNGRLHLRQRLLSPFCALRILRAAHEAGLHAENEAEKGLLYDVVVRISYAPWMFPFHGQMSYLADTMCYLGNMGEPPSTSEKFVSLHAQWLRLRYDRTNRDKWC